MSPSLTEHELVLALLRDVKTSVERLSCRIEDMMVRQATQEESARQRQTRLDDHEIRLRSMEMAADTPDPGNAIELSIKRHEAICPLSERVRTLEKQAAGWTVRWGFLIAIATSVVIPMLITLIVTAAKGFKP